MSKAHDPDDLPLFRDLPDIVPAPVIRSWRTTPADSWAQEPPLPRALESHCLDLLRRDLEFLKALERAGASVDTPQVQRFQELHGELARHCVQSWDAESPGDGDGLAEAIRLIPDTVAELAGLRRSILEELEPGPRRTALAAESRVRIQDSEVERVIAMAGFQRAEERGEVTEVELLVPGEPAPFPSPGSVDQVVRGLLEKWRADQERRPLPARGRLTTLLSGIPAAWLDATWEALGMGPDRPAHRKERERRIARHLTETETLRDVVENRLSAEERRLLAFLLEGGGRMPASHVVRHFGHDRGDGWFWNEEPPTSLLGRLRLHGLAFVGVGADAVRSTRIVLVPAELGEPLGRLLPAREEGVVESARSDADLQPDVVDALERAFPEGTVELIGDESWLTEMLDDLREALSRLPGAQVLYERDPDDESSYDLSDDWDPADEWNPGAWDVEEPSYALFFVCPQGDDFRFEIEGDVIDEEGRRRSTTGVGQIGHVVAISTLAPLALLRVTSMDSEEDEYGEMFVSIPEIQFRVFDADGQPQRSDAFLLDGLSDAAIETLHELRDGIVRVLDTFDIAPLPEEEARKPVPWLEAADHVLGVGPGEPVTVEDALFFRCL